MRPDLSCDATVVHLTDDSPVNLDQHIRWMIDHLPGVDADVVSRSAYEGTSPTVYDIQFEMMIDFQKSYIQEDVRYDGSNRASLGISPAPQVTREVMHRQIQDALRRFDDIGTKNERIIARLRETAKQAG